MAENSFFITAPCNNIYESKIPIDTDSASALCFEVTKDGKKLFMKQLRDEFLHIEDYHILFRKEYELGHNISHPNIVNYEYFHEDEDSCYLLMEYIAGETLDCFIASHPDYFSSRKNLSRFSNQLLSALKCLHDNHVVYSDLKPENIMLTQVGNDVKLIDLGFCFVDAYSRTVGTTQKFAAPEHNDISQIDVTTDIYCIGRLLEYIDDNSASRLPKKYRTIMKKCLQPDKNDRYQRVGEIIQKINSHKKRNIALSVVSTIILLSIATIFLPFNSSSNDSIWNDTLTLNYVKYSHFNDINATCEIVGADSTSNLYFEEKIKYNENLYTVTQIADSIFINRNDIVTIHFPIGIKRIGKYAFRDCKGLTAINMPNSIEEIGPWAFWGCDSIKSLNLSSKLKEIPTACFAGYSCKHLSIPDGIEKINVDAFSQNDFIESITLPSSVRVLERGVFFNNPQLKEVSLPAGLEIIGEYQFYGCENLRHIYNLNPCLQEILAIHRNPSQITLHVPAESVEAYKNAPYWQEMNIVAIEEK